MAITLCSVYGQLLDLTGRVIVGAQVTAKPNVSSGVSVVNTDGLELDSAGVVATTGVDGSFAISLTPSASFAPVGLAYTLVFPGGVKLGFTVPSTTSYNPLSGVTTAKPATFGVPATCLVSGTLVDISGTPKVGTTLTFGLDGWDKGLVVTTSGGLVLPRPVSAISVTAGAWSIPLLQAASLVPVGLVRAYLAGPLGLFGRFTVPASAGALWTTLL